MTGLKPDHVYQKDCLEGLAEIPAGSAALAFADPPFNIGYKYDVYHDKKESETYLEWTHKWMTGITRALSPAGTFWLAIGDEYAAELKIIAQDQLGLTCKSWVIWYYTFGVNCKFRFSRSHTHLFYFVKDPKRFTFNHMEIRVPSARQLVYNDGRADPDGRLPDNTWILRPQDLPLAFKPDEDTWYFPRVCGTFKERAGWHGCQMPEQLLGRIIRACSNRGDLVLDPFGGSGTTFAVAKKLDRRFIGFEISPEYVKRIRHRLEGIKPGDPLDGAEDPRYSAPATPRNRVPKQVERESRKRIATDPAKPKAKPVVRRKSTASAGRKSFKAITEAFLKTHCGFSIDRVIADPKLDADFVAACCELGVDGKPADWNRCLLGLRKAGRLRALPKVRKTAFARSEMDRFLFAGEMAWSLIAERHGKSLDDILCDPDIAAEFDQLAAGLAPGWEPLHYRWGALHTRKEANKKKRDAKRLPPELAAIRTFPQGGRLVDYLRRVPSEPGVYLLRTNGDDLYLGETTELHGRVQCHADRLSFLLSSFCRPTVSVGDVRIHVLPLPNRLESCRLGLQSLLMGRLKSRPLANANFDKQACLS